MCSLYVVIMELTTQEELIKWVKESKQQKRPFALIEPNLPSVTVNTPLVCLNTATFYNHLLAHIHTQNHCLHPYKKNMERTKSSPIFLLFFYNLFFYSDVDHNMKEKICCYFHYITTVISSSRILVRSDRLIRDILSTESPWLALCGHLRGNSLKRCPEVHFYLSEPVTGDKRFFEPGWLHFSIPSASVQHSKTLLSQ